MRMINSNIYWHIPIYSFKFHDIFFSNIITNVILQYANAQTQILKFFALDHESYVFKNNITLSPNFTSNPEIVEKQSFDFYITPCFDDYLKKSIPSQSGININSLPRSRPIKILPIKKRPPIITHHASHPSSHGASRHLHFESFTRLAVFL